MAQVDPELIARVHRWRQMAMDGSATTEEMKEAIIFLREHRTKATDAAAASASGKRSASRAKPIRSSDDMLSELI